MNSLEMEKKNKKVYLLEENIDDVKKEYGSFQRDVIKIYNEISDLWGKFSTIFKACNKLIRSKDVDVFCDREDELVGRYSIVYNKESDKLIMYTKGKILFEGNISDIEEVENLLADYYTYDRDNLDESYNSSANKLKTLRQIYNNKHNQ